MTVGVTSNKRTFISMLCCCFHKKKQEKEPVDNRIKKIAVRARSESITMTPDELADFGIKHQNRIIQHNKRKTTS